MERPRKAVARWEIVTLNKVLTKYVKQMREEEIGPNYMVMLFEGVLKNVNIYDLDNPEERLHAYRLLKDLDNQIVKTLDAYT
jgi:hypothetical protein